MNEYLEYLEYYSFNPDKSIVEELCPIFLYKMNDNNEMSPITDLKYLHDIKKIIDDDTLSITEIYNFSNISDSLVTINNETTNNSETVNKVIEDEYKFNDFLHDPIIEIEFDNILANISTEKKEDIEAVIENNISSIDDKNTVLSIKKRKYICKIDINESFEDREIREYEVKRSVLYNSIDVLEPLLKHANNVRRFLKSKLKPILDYKHILDGKKACLLTKHGIKSIIRQFQTKRLNIHQRTYLKRLEQLC